MNDEFVKDKIENIIIKTMLKDLNYALKIFAIVTSHKTFRREPTQKLYLFVREYYEKYQKLPSAEMMTSLSSSHEDLTGFMTEVNAIPDELVSNRDFVIDLSTEYLKRTLFRNALLESALAIEETEKYEAVMDKMRQAMEVSFEIYLGMSYIDSLEERLKFSRAYNIDGIKTGIDILNDTLDIGHGYLPKNIYVFSSEANMGKSIFLCNAATEAMMQNKNVLFISLEMQEFFIGQRIDAILTRINISDIYDHDKETELKKRYEGFTENLQGNIFIKEYPPGTVNVHHIRALCNDLRMYQGFTPDIIIVDYINLMGSARESSNEYYKLKHVTEEMRALSYEFNAPVVTASQLNRGGYDNNNPTMGDMGESMGIVHTADVITMLSQTDDERLMGMIQCHVVKNRLGPKDVTFPTAINYNNLRIDNFQVTRN